MATEQHASIMKVFDNTGSMRRDVYEVSSGTDGGGMAMEQWEGMRQARRRLSEALGKNTTSPPTRQELFGALFSLFVAVWAWRPTLHAARRREK